MEKHLAKAVVGWLVAVLLVVGASVIAGAQTNRAKPEADAPSVARGGEANALFGRAVAAYQEKRLDDAADMLRALLKRYPRNVAVLNNLAVVLFEMDRPDEAIELLRRALSTDESIMTAYGNLTAVYERKAADAYRNALNIEPKDADPLPLDLIKALRVAPPEAARGRSRRGAKVLAAQPRGVEPTVVDEVVRADNIDRPFVDDPVQATAKADKRTPKPRDAARAPVGTTTQKPAQQESAIEDAVNRWANAWSDRDLSAYYASYVSGHSPRNLTHEEWRAFRAKRLTAPQNIEVTLLDFVIADMTRDKAQVEFVQRYRSSLLSSNSLKRLYLVRENGDWKIAREMLLRRLK